MSERAQKGEGEEKREGKVGKEGRRGFISLHIFSCHVMSCHIIRLLFCRVYFVLKCSLCPTCLSLFLSLFLSLLFYYPIASYLASPCFLFSPFRVAVLFQSRSPRRHGPTYCTVRLERFLFFRYYWHSLS